MDSIYDIGGASGKDQSRERIIIRTSIVGIAANLCLAGFKAVIGLMCNSIVIVLDAVNNITDAGSSIVTIVGTKLAGREPDKYHPFGHGRIEYLSAMIISVIILYAGVTSFVESVKQIVRPETPEYNVVSLIIVAVAVLVKILLGRYVKGVGVKVRFPSQFRGGREDGRFHLRVHTGRGVHLHVFPCIAGSLARRCHLRLHHQNRICNAQRYHLTDPR